MCKKVLQKKFEQLLHCTFEFEVMRVDCFIFGISGHNHIVNHVDWSHCGSRLLTSSDDRSAAVWVKGQSEPVLTFKGVQRSFSTKDGSKNFLVKLYF